MAGEGWSIDELAERAATALAREGVTAPNGRISPVPDRRVIRWYATIGLLDRPLRTRSRTARYGERHLLQLLAVKRRQAEGRSLTEIQAELAGATDASLRRVAGPAADPAQPDPAQPGPGWPGDPDRPPERADPAPTRARFWAQAGPAAASDPPTSPPGTPPATLPAPPALVPPAPQPPAAVYPLALHPGATLVLAASPAAADLAAIHATAAPLLDLLASRGLLASTSPSPEQPRRSA